MQLAGLADWDIYSSAGSSSNLRPRRVKMLQSDCCSHWLTGVCVPAQEGGLLMQCITVKHNVSNDAKMQPAHLRVVHGSGRPTGRVGSPFLLILVGPVGSGHNFFPFPFLHVSISLWWFAATDYDKLLRHCASKRYLFTMFDFSVWSSFIEIIFYHTTSCVEQLWFVQTILSY